MKFIDDKVEQRMTGGHYAIAPSAAKATWSASKSFCPAHCRVHRHPFTMVTDPLWRDYQSRFHSFLVATRPGLRQRVFAVYPRPRICVIHLTNTTLAPPSRKSQLRSIIVRCPANACGAYWMTAATIQCP